MQRVILVVSPDADFLQQIRSHLEEGGRFQVTCAASAHEALNLANSNFYEVAILDGDIDDIPLVPFSRDLAALQSELKILVFSPDNDPKHPLLKGLPVNGYLTKPFSSPEIGKALSNLFSDQPAAIDNQVNQVDDLMKQWLQHPETGGEKANQILKSTTAQTVLIMIKGQSTASSGSISDNLIAKVTGFLSRYWKEDEDSELARFLKIDGDGSERFLYAIKLVGNVVLVLIYPFTSTIQQIRRELNRVKEEFQKNYPTTSELRQEIANLALADINKRSKALEEMQPFSGAISESELDELKSLLNKPIEKKQTPDLSEEELSNFDKIIADMPSPDPELKLNMESPLQSRVEENKLPDWLNELHQSEEVVESNKTSTISSEIQEEKPPFTTVPFIKNADLPGSEVDNLSDLFKSTEISAGESRPQIEPLPEIDFQLPWEIEGSIEDTVPVAVSTHALNSTLEYSNPHPDSLIKNEVDSSEPDNVLEALLEDYSTAVNSSSPLSTSDKASNEKGQNLQTSIEEPAVEAAFIPPLEIKEPSIPSKNYHVSSQSSNTEKILFNYTCILIPDNREQFLARDLSERLSIILPQFHLAQGWQLTSITIRPQYMLWTVSVPLSVCPHQIIHDIRGLTSAYIFANFPELAKMKTTDNFWSSNYLAISGSTPPPVNLIFNYVSQAWKNHETITL